MKLTDWISLNSLIVLITFITLVIVFFGLWQFYHRDQALKLGRQGQFFTSHKGPIFYQVHGEKGPVIVLVHGLGASSYCWRNVIPSLSSQARVLTYDLWGFGQSCKTLDGPMTLDDQVQVLRELLDQLHITSLYIVGHSMGGEIAMWFAHEHPKRVRKLVAIAPAIDPSLVSDTLKRMTWLARWTRWLISKKMIRQTLKYLFSEPHKVSHSIVDAYYQPYRDPAAHLCFAAALDIIRDHRVYDQLEEISPPVFLLWGDKDKVVPRRLMDTLLERLPQASGETHPEAGHMPMEDDPQWVVKQVKAQFFKA